MCVCVCVRVCVYVCVCVCVCVRERERSLTDHRLWCNRKHERILSSVGPACLCWAVYDSQLPRRGTQVRHIFHAYPSGNIKAFTPILPPVQKKRKKKEKKKNGAGTPFCAKHPPRNAGARTPRPLCLSKSSTCGQSILRQTPSDITRREEEL